MTEPELLAEINATIDAGTRALRAKDMDTYHALNDKERRLFEQLRDMWDARRKAEQ